MCPKVVYVNALNVLSKSDCELSVDLVIIQLTLAVGLQVERQFS
jgi:hypothetical protein